MTEFVVTRDADSPWQDFDPSRGGTIDEREPAMRFKLLLPDAEGQPNVQRLRYEPNQREQPHAHSEDELMFVLAGSVMFGSEELVAGDSLFIRRDTRYSLRTGEAGVEVLRIGLSGLGPSAATGSTGD